MFSAVGCTFPVLQSEMLMADTPMAFANARLERLFSSNKSVNRDANKFFIG